mgnify:CR=1 FL=1
MAMNRSSVIYLVEETHQQNDYGVIETTYTPRKVFADVTSVSSREWFDGGRNGLNPEFRMTMFFGDYQGERELLYKILFDMRNDINELKRMMSRAMGRKDMDTVRRSSAFGFYCALGSGVLFSVLVMLFFRRQGTRVSCTLAR